MAKYYINQKFAIRDRFTIKDENERDVFQATGELLSFGKKITLKTMDGKDLLLMKEKLFRLLSQYDFYVGDELICEMKREFTLFKPRYNIQFPNWEIQGDIWDHNYEITENGRVIARIRKKFFAFLDSYEIEIFNDDYTELLLGIVIAVDADIEKKRQSAN